MRRTEAQFSGPDPRQLMRGCRPTHRPYGLATGEPAADVRALLVVGPLEAGRIVLAQERAQDERDEEDGDEEDRQDSHDAPPRVGCLSSLLEYTRKVPTIRRERGRRNIVRTPRAARAA